MRSRVRKLRGVRDSSSWQAIVWYTDNFDAASLTVSVTTDDSNSTAPTSLQSTRVSTPNPNAAGLDNLDLLLSLDTALELIHADRDSLKRAETFSGYPGSYGHRVRDTIEEIFVLLLQALGERHIKPGFQTCVGAYFCRRWALVLTLYHSAIEQMKSYKPAEHEETKSVAPLLQFFELVHIGDTMQSMIQVYFDKELVRDLSKVQSDALY